MCVNQFVTNRALHDTPRITFNASVYSINYYIHGLNYIPEQLLLLYQMYSLN